MLSPLFEICGRAGLRSDELMLRIRLLSEKAFSSKLHFDAAERLRENPHIQQVASGSKFTRRLASTQADASP